MAKRKKINFKLIDRLTGPEPYQILAKMMANHGELEDANIAIAWRIGFTSDKDGHLTLGKCMKASDLQRELVQYDFVILLNREIWQDPQFTDAQKCALLDHEMCHAARAFDDEGNAKIDERGRPVWRMRKHDIEEFQEIVRRHGCYKRDLERFAEALLNKRAAPLFDQADEPESEEQGAPLAAAHLVGGTHQSKRKPRPGVN